MLGIEDENEINLAVGQASYKPSIPIPKLNFCFEKSVRNAPELSSSELADLEEGMRRKRGDGTAERELDEKRLGSRQKQLDYGKNTVGYQQYLSMVPRRQRKRDDPRTPDKYQLCSKRSWDGQISKWRRLLHKFDPQE